MWDNIYKNLVSWWPVGHDGNNYCRNENASTMHTSLLWILTFQWIFITELSIKKVPFDFCFYESIISLNFVPKDWFLLFLCFNMLDSEDKFLFKIKSRRRMAQELNWANILFKSPKLSRPVQRFYLEEEYPCIDFVSLEITYALKYFVSSRLARILDGTVYHKLSRFSVKLDV